MVVTICLDTASIGEWKEAMGRREDASLSLKNIMMGGVNKGRLFVLLGKWLGRLLGGVPSHSESGQHVCNQHSIAIKTFSL